MNGRLIALGILAATCALAGRASAAPATYVSLNGEIGSDIGLMSAAGVELGHRFGDSHLSGHVAFMAGSFNGLEEAVGSNTDTDFYRGHGSFLQGRLGLEYLDCSEHGAFCGVYGGDVGLLVTGKTSGPFEATPAVSYTEQQVIPRVGFDTGGEHLRFRMMLDYRIGMAQRSEPQKGSTSGPQGFGLGVALAYRF